MWAPPNKFVRCRSGGPWLFRASLRVVKGNRHKFYTNLWCDVYKKGALKLAPYLFILNWIIFFFIIITENLFSALFTNEFNCIIIINI